MASATCSAWRRHRYSCRSCPCCGSNPAGHIPFSKYSSAISRACRPQFQTRFGPPVILQSPCQLSRKYKPTASTRCAPPDPAPVRARPLPASTPSNPALPPDRSSSPAKTPPNSKLSRSITVRPSARLARSRTSLSKPSSRPIGIAGATQESKPSSCASWPPLRTRLRRTRSARFFWLMPPKATHSKRSFAA